VDRNTHLVVPLALALRLSSTRRVAGFEAERALLMQLGKRVEKGGGWWPGRKDFRTRENHELVDQMTQDRLVQVAHGYYTWTLLGLRLVKDDAFLGAELRRMWAVAEAMTKRLDAKQGEAVTVYDLAKQLGWQEPNDVRRAAYMLAISQPGAIHIARQIQGSNAIPMVPEAIAPDEGLWKLSEDLIMNGPPQRPAPPTPPEPEPAMEPEGIFFDPTSRRVFVVHGHDEAAMLAVARLLEKLDLEPIILHEQPSKGRTVIEKFVDHAETAAFAVALLTPDDEGRVKAKAPKSRALSDRARQNVIFEAGYFIGRLGRQNVVLLYKPGVELPSDVQGVIYIEMDTAGAWRLELLAEIEAAGISVDANRLTGGDARAPRVAARARAGEARGRAVARRVSPGSQRARPKRRK